ncbi:bifunctional 3'-5' exonuclease/DNA polymerase [Microbacterium sp. MC2]
MPTVWSVVGHDEDRVVVVDLAADAVETGRQSIAPERLPALIAAAGDVRRWVFSDVGRWYPDMLRAGVRVSRAHDLRLCHAILRDSVLVTDADPLRGHAEWDVAAGEPGTPAAPALFELNAAPGVAPPDAIADVLAEFVRQHTALAGARDPGRLRLLLAAESAGALIAAELHSAGVPWDIGVHDGILADAFGRPGPSGLPAEIERLAAEVRTALGDPAASLDSQPKLLRALHRAGVPATSTARWELAEHDHPVIAPLLAYKKLMRLHTANGWAWLREWVADGRFRPVYVPGGVVTGRWASSGGGALQLPRQLRPAVRADPGWVLVVADVAQLEPRMLAAMSADTALADASRGRDLYAGIVDRGVVETRQDAKIAMLGAMYGATTGDSGRLVPALRRAYPRAMGLVDNAARTGEAGGVVSTWLGRTSPAPPTLWRTVQSAAADGDAAAGERARRAARDRGRFTRNFVVQGTAAEWALAWLADLRQRLAALPVADAATPATASGPVFSRRAHLAFFLHDEIIVHAPAEHADAATAAVRAAAAHATTLLFGRFPIDVPLDLRVTADAGKT